jgi:hypothetical protein
MPVLEIYTADPVERTSFTPIRLATQVMTKASLDLRQTILHFTKYFIISKSVLTLKIVISFAVAGT